MINSALQTSYFILYTHTVLYIIQVSEDFTILVRIQCTSNLFWHLTGWYRHVVFSQVVYRLN